MTQAHEFCIFTQPIIFIERGYDSLITLMHRKLKSMKQKP